MNEADQKEIFLGKLKQGELIEIQAPWFERYFQLQFLHEYLEQSDLEELIIHHPRKLEMMTFHEQKLLDIDLDQELWNWVVSYLCLKQGCPFHLNRPFASFMLELGGITLRASFIHEATLAGPYHKAFLRVLNKQSFSLKKFCGQRPMDFLLEDVEQKKNILISGATGSGKTSLLKTLFHHSAQKKNHIITIEDTHELQHDYPWVTALIAKEHQQYSMEQYLSYAMRMRPERIVLGEIRSGEVVPLLLALNCGHNGMLSTVHANSAPDALYRLATLFQIYNNQTLPHQVVMSLLCHNIHRVVHMEQKKITQVIKVLGHDEGRLIFDLATP